MGQQRILRQQKALQQQRIPQRLILQRWHVPWQQECHHSDFIRMSVSNKTSQETYLKTNLQAAGEIAVQLRLRNLSGIIIVDFIDMKEEESRKTLLAALRRAVTADPVKTVLVDMTPLGLVELTRKKIRRPLHEQVR